MHYYKITFICTAVVKANNKDEAIEKLDDDDFVFSDQNIDEIKQISKKGVLDLLKNPFNTNDDENIFE